MKERHGERSVRDDVPKGGGVGGRRCPAVSIKERVCGGGQSSNCDESLACSLRLAMLGCSMSLAGMWVTAAPFDEVSSSSDSGLGSEKERMWVVRVCMAREDGV